MSASLRRGAPIASLRRGAAIASTALLTLLGGCSAWSDGPGYYWQSMAGHLAVMREARPIRELLAQPGIDPALRHKLEQVLEIRRFASADLALPANGSYTEYADLKRPFVVWNVFATPELSMKLQEWCFPVAGCVTYRGYYDRQDAERFAAKLRADGLEAFVRGVPAYSTLGWTEWLGGDPLLSTFIRYPQGELARLVFHELAHQVVYVRDDTVFNESYATAVERLGVARWLAEQADAAARAEYEAFDARRRDFRALVHAARDDLRAIYDDAALDDGAKRAAKADRMARLRADHARVKTERWDGFAGYDRWFEQANNAALGIQAAYDELVPDFERLFEREGRDFARFHAAVRELARLPKAERLATLRRSP